MSNAVQADNSTKPAELAKRSTVDPRKTILLSDRQRAMQYVRIVRAAFDAAQTTKDNERHWALADSLSANAALNPQVRRLLRTRSRYEVANNSYAKGIGLTLANDLVGTGPRLQMLTALAAANQFVERSFARWAREIRLAEKLRTMRLARYQDGEAFAILATNPRLRHPVKLDLKLIEADQVTTPDLFYPDEKTIDGIRYDDYGNPIEYHVLKQHPGDNRMLHTMSPLDYDRIPAEVMIHWFRNDRPGQGRGIPDITPALPLFAQLRRYTLAVIAAAETAADFAGVLYTESPPSDDDDPDPVEPLDVLEIEKRMLTTLPNMWKLEQLKAEQPATTYFEFVRSILNEIARCLNMPFNVAAGNSAGYNYASGRLDHQTYYKAIRIEEADAEIVILDRVLEMWLFEAVRIAGFMPINYRSVLSTRELPDHQWFWDGKEHVDPQKEADAQETRLKNHTTTLAAEYAKQGKDWEVELRQRAKEVALMNELGLPAADAKPESESKSKSKTKSRSANEDDDEEGRDDAS